jgi:hypothetical protein
MADLVVRVTRELQAVKNPVSQPKQSVRSTEVNRPLCFLTGHPRSGTTLLEQLLALHPKISSADESSAFFHNIVYPLVFPSKQTAAGPVKNPLPKLSLRDFRIDRVPQPARRERIQAYLSQLEFLASDKNQNHYLIDKSPGGLIDLPIIESALPKTKIIVVLRDPRDICISCFQQFLGVNLTSINFNTLENTASKIVRDLRFWIAFRDITELDWVEVRYENLIANPESELCRVFQFLSLPEPADISRNPLAANAPIIHSPSYAEVIQPISDHSIGRWKNYGDWFKRAEEILSPMLPALGYS